MGLREFFKSRGKQNSEKREEPEKYPARELEKFVGETIEVHYIHCGRSKTPEIAVLKASPSQSSFYLGNDVGYHIIYWDSEDNHGRHAVRLIKGPGGKVIYENKEVPYDFPLRGGDSAVAQV